MINTVFKYAYLTHDNERTNSNTNSIQAFVSLPMIVNNVLRVVVVFLSLFVTWSDKPLSTLLVVKMGEKKVVVVLKMRPPTKGLLSSPS